jgi:hypothetical protein
VDGVTNVFIVVAAPQLLAINRNNLKVLFCALIDLSSKILRCGGGS